MKRNWTIGLPVALALALSACGSSPAVSSDAVAASTSRPAHHEQYGAVYVSADGHYCTRTYDDSGVLTWWIYYWIATSGNTASASSPSLSGGSWRSSGAVTPTGLTPTDRAVKVNPDEKDNEPTEEVEAKSDVPSQDQVTDADTSAEEAQAEVEAEAAADAADAGEPAADDPGQPADGGEPADPGGNVDNGGDPGGAVDPGGDVGGGDVGGGGEG